ncbi:hypothetical protein COHA_000572 [Chlorella ohadii]|uniref:Uncharacterized protein n=1 Tax=Chlorella ohadii TaxID=2649997 RepID=A0AAD5H8X0_9CHLO|nr:hypothetical protein COHA_000572 [Chlorella ohadii]
MPKKGKRQGKGREASAVSPSGRRAAGEPLHREEALALVAKQMRRDFAAEAQQMEARIQEDKERMGPGWQRAYVDGELDADPALLYWITVRGHKADEWFVTFEEFEHTPPLPPSALHPERRELPQWRGAHRASFAVVSFEEEAVQARKMAQAVEQAAKAEAHFQKQVEADRERRGLSVA